MFFRLSIFLKFLVFLLFIWSIASLYFFGNSDIQSTSGIAPYITSIIVTLIEILAILVTIFNFKILVFNNICRIVILWSVFMFLNVLLNSSNILFDLREVIWWPSVFLIFFSIFYKRNLEFKFNFIIKGMVALFLILFIQFVLIRFSNIEFSLATGGLSLNHVFYVVLLSPFIFLITNKTWKYILMFLAIVAALISFKRSAMICMFLIFLISIYFDFIKDKKGSFFSKIFIVIIVIVGLSSLYEHLNSGSDDYITNRLTSISDDGGSGRTDIYAIVFNSFENQFFENQLMGAGHNGVRNSGIVWETRGITNQNLSSHNDFIEVIYDYGIIGIIIYLFFIKKVISNTFKIRKINIKLFQANIVSLVMFIVMSMVSHLILYPTYFAYLVILWAITASYLHKIKRNNYEG